MPVRLAESSDAEIIGQLLDDFNREYDDPTPGPPALAERMRELVTGEETAVLLADGAPNRDQRGADGLAVLRFRPGIWSTALECYLAELYVVPDRRGQGTGRALMEAAIELARARGADHMDLGTGEDDVAARALYESLGFDNHERPGGPIAYFYQRDL
ncbi:MAG TPA: GNAT family N-acetyltransferase [Solirubrobacteraceae bacterium]|jgi:ribosomal protein S18 acetylase RimI-like enzyme